MSSMRQREIPSHPRNRERLNLGAKPKVTDLPVESNDSVDEDDSGMPLHWSQMNAALSLCSEKAVASRTRGCASLTELFLAHADVNWLEGRSLTVTNTLCKCILKASNAQEAEAASRALQVLLVMQPSICSDIFQNKGELLSQVTHATTNGGVRAAIGKLSGALSLACYATQDTYEYEAILTSLEDAIEVSSRSKSAGEVQALSELIRSWTVTACVYSISRRAGELHERMLNAYVNAVLTTSDPFVRIHAAEAIGLLVESKQLCKAQDIGLDFGNTGCSPNNLRSVGHEDLLNRLTDFVDEGNVTSGAKGSDANEVKKVVSDVIDQLEHKLPPEGRANIAGQHVEVEGWDNVLLLKYLRMLSGSAVDRLGNIEGSLLEEYLDIEADGVDQAEALKMDRKAKIAHARRNEKANALHRNKNRDKKVGNRNRSNS